MNNVVLTRGSRRFVFLTMVLLMFLAVLALLVMASKGSSGERTWYVDDDGGADFEKIQDAVNASADGDSIRVWEGTYEENVVVDRTVSLVGNGSGVTTVDGGRRGDVVQITADWVNMSGFLITGRRWQDEVLVTSNYNHLSELNCIDIGTGIRLSSSTGNILENNNCSGNWWGISLGSSSNDNLLINNTIFENHYMGLHISNSRDNLLRNNRFMKNKNVGLYLYSSQNTLLENNRFTACGISIAGNELAYWNSHDMDESNTVNGKPVRYYKDKSGLSVEKDAGPIILANCTEMTVANQNINSTNRGITLGFSNNNLIVDNNCSGNEGGIRLSHSNSNIVKSNKLYGNSGVGITLGSSHSNRIENNSCDFNENAGFSLTEVTDNLFLENHVSNNGEGFSVRRSSYNNFTGNTVTENGRGFAINTESLKNRVLYNNIFNNSVYGIDISNNENNDINATNNWWGHESGPYHLVNNTGGKGDNVTDYVIFDPWLKEVWGPRTFYVDDGAPNGGNGSKAHPFNRIQDAVNASDDGDTIRVWEGVYYENVVVNRSVSLIGNGSETTVIDGGGAGDIVRVEADYVTINGFEIQNSGSRFDAGIVVQANNTIIMWNNISNNEIGIYLDYNTGSITIMRNTILSNDFGICLLSSNNNTIANNTISNNKDGIFLDESTYNITIADNTITSSDRNGIHLRESSNITIVNTTISNSGRGISTQDSDNTTIMNNTCSNNDYGIYVHDKHNRIHNNNCSSNRNSGIHLKASGRNTIHNNTCTDNQHGIHLEDFSSYNIIENNSCYENTGNGIRLWDNCDKNMITNNQCLRNQWAGIFLHYSNKRNTITWNTCLESSTYSGIEIEEHSDYNIVANNTCSSNYNSGISIYYFCDENTVTDNNCSSNKQSGVFLRRGGENHFSGNVISGNPVGVQVIDPFAGNVFVGNTIADNTNYGINVTDNASNHTINATHNWWGDKSGPYHPVNNTAGKGDTVTDYVIFDPWLTEPVGQETHRGRLSGFVTDTFDEPLEGVKLRIEYHETIRVTYSYGNGYYAFWNIPDCECLKKVTATKEGYLAFETEIGIGEDTILDITLEFEGASGVLYVDDDAPDGGDGSKEKPFNRIQDAVNASDDGYSIRVWAGVYYENVVANKTLFLIGNGSDVVTIDGTDQGTTVYVEADWVNITGFTVTGAGPYYPTGPSPDHKGIWLQGNHSRISGVISSGNNNFGIYLQGNFNTISQSTCSDNRFTGIVSVGSFNRVFQNICFNNSVGIALAGWWPMDSSHHNIVSDNICKGNSRCGIWLDGSSSNNITGNVFSSNKGNGLSMSGSDHNMFTNNTFNDNRDLENDTSFGIYFHHRCSNNTFTGNTIMGNKYGFKVWDYSKDNVARNNTIMDNHNAGVDLNNVKNGTFDARYNWWGSDSGPYHYSTNPTGKGNKVTDYVIFDPWTGKKEGSVYIRVETDRGIYEKGEDIEITLVLVNELDREMTYGFPTPHQTDIIIYDASGTEVFREPKETTVWITLLTSFSVEANSETVIETYTWDQRDSHGNQVEYGDYRIYGTLVGYDVDGEKEIAITEATYVSAEASDGGDGSWERPFNRIQDAIDASNEGDLIRVWEGVYKENVVVNRTLSLIGNGSDVVTIDGADLGTTVDVGADWVNISGFTVTGAGPQKSGSIRVGYVYPKGIWLLGNHNTVSEINCSGNAHYGIYLDGDFNLVSKNTCSNNGYDGITSHGDSSRISENTCIDNRYGIRIWGGDRYTISDNVCERNWAGIYISSSSSNTISGNVFSNNERHGMYMAGSDHNIISNNSCNDNLHPDEGFSFGIYFQRKCSNNILTCNTIMGNKYGIKAWDYSKDNVARSNTIMDNHNAGIDLNNIKNGIFDARYNYWGSDTGPYHETKNPGGTGNKVTDYVIFDPWTREEAGPAYIRVETDRDIYEKEEDIEITFVLVNKLDEELTYSFGNPHQTDIIIYDARGEEVFRHPEENLDWPAVMTYITIEANSEAIIGSHTWDQRDGDGNPVEYGSYRVYGTLVGYDVDDEKEIAITEATHVWAEAPPGGDGSRERPFNRIQDAIDASDEGSLIRVWEGTYEENVVIEKTLSLIGNGSDLVTIDGADQGTTVDVEADWVNITGFTVTGAGPHTTGSGPKSKGIWLRGDYSRIVETNCSGNANYGMWIQGDFNLVSNNICSNNGYDGIISHGDSCRISTNTCIDNHYGIRIWGGDHWTISDNVCQRNWVGIYIASSSYNIIRGNTFSNNRLHGMNMARSDYNIISNNSCNDNLHPDEEFSFGVYFHYMCSNNIFTGNTITGNKYGIKAWDYSTDNVARNNTIMGNHNAAIDLNNIKNGTFDARYNYWGSNTGPYHPTKNPDGTGNKVTDHVEFDPWLNEGGTVNDTSSETAPDDPTTPGEEDLRLVLVIGLVGLVLFLAIAFAASEVIRYYLFSLLLLPLYSRLSGKDIEDDIRQHSIRGRIYQYIEDNPGVNFSSIMKRISAGNGTTTYHLSVLEREGFIKAATNGNYKLFWARREFPGVPDAIVTEIQKEILGLLERRGSMSRKELLEETGISKSTLHFNIKQLVLSGRVREEKKGKEHYCSLR